MFALHESTRRGLCRMGFVLVCILPVCAIAAASVWINSDAQRKSYERTLTQMLSLDVSIDRVVLTHLNGIRYEGIRFADPETGAPVGEVVSATFVKQAKVIEIEILDSKLNAGQAERFKEIVMRYLRIGKTGDSIRISLTRLELQDSGKTFDVLDDVKSEFTYDVKKALFTSEFRPTHSPLGEKVELAIQRNREDSPPTTQSILHSTETILCCKTLAVFAPVVRRLGDECRFQGMIHSFDTPQGCQQDINGTFNNVDLSSLSKNGFANRLNGNAAVFFAEMTFIDGRIHHALGEFRCDKGTLDPSFSELLTAKKAHNGSWPFIELGFEFDLNPAGLVLKGKCTSETPGAVLVDQKTGQPFLAAAEGKRIPLHEIERILSQSRTALRLLPSTSDRARY